MKIDFGMLEKLVEAGATAAVIVAVLRSEQEQARKVALRQANRRKAGEITIEIRQAVYDRDNWECVYCGVDDDLSCDHVVPVSKGGLTTLENLVTACRRCNSRKQDKDRKSFERHLENEGKSKPVRRKSTDTKPTSEETPSQIAERELYARGKQLCGNRAGGLVSRLLAHHGYDIGAARKVIEIAATKHDPREYLVGSMRTKNGSGNPTMAAFDDLIARAAGGAVEDSDNIVDVTPSSS